MGNKICSQNIDKNLKNEQKQIKTSLKYFNLKKTQKRNQKSIQIYLVNNTHQESYSKRTLIGEQEKQFVITRNVQDLWNIKSFKEQQTYDYEQKKCQFVMKLADNIEKLLQNYDLSEIQIYSDSSNYDTLTFFFQLFIDVILCCQAGFQRKCKDDKKSNINTNKNDKYYSQIKKKQPKPISIFLSKQIIEGLDNVKPETIQRKVSEELQKLFSF